MTTRYAPILNPAAGADWSFTPSTEAPTRVISVLGKLTTSATAQTRVPAIQIKDLSGNVIYYSAPSVSQIASLDDYWQYVSAEIGASVAGLWDASDSINTVMMPKMWLPPGFSINAKTYLLDTTDQWNALYAIYETHESRVDEIRHFIADEIADGLAFV